MEDLTKKLKVGDTVYMPLKITRLDAGNEYPIHAKINSGIKLSFTKDGKHLENAECTDITLSVSQYPKVMEVSATKAVWKKRVVIAEHNNGFIAVSEAESIDESKLCDGVTFFKFAREIQPEK